MATTPRPIGTTTKPEAAKRAPRTRLADATSGIIHGPTRVLLFGVDKIGKTTFGACAPAPIFFGAEDGSSQLDVYRYPQPRNAAGDPIPLDWLDLLDCIDQLTNESHKHRSFVLDTVDWLEPLIWSWICERDGKSNIEDYGYGKGYTAALEQWRILVSRLDTLIYRKKMNVILLGHAVIKTFKNPEGEDYDRFELSLNAKASGLLRQWVDAALFANHEIYSVASKDEKRHRGISTGNRIVHTERSAAWDAGNRYGLPLQIDLSWDAFWSAITANAPRTLEQVMAELDELLKHVPDHARPVVQAQIASKEGNVPALERYAAKLRERASADANAEQQQAS